MRGVKSYGMLMAASDASHENVELLAPPEGSLPGERVWFGSADELENLPDAASPNQVVFLTRIVIFNVCTLFYLSLMHVPLRNMQPYLHCSAHHILQIFLPLILLLSS